jgi:S-adenosylmethionine decarboxylase
MIKLYNPGLHYIATLHTSSVGLLTDMEAFKTELNRLINLHNLTSVGQVWHSFTGAGFTAAAALTESHISIHTWPEFGQATFDVFLSNFSRDNDETVTALADSIAEYFKATLTNIHQIKR